MKKIMITILMALIGFSLFGCQSENSTKNQIKRLLPTEIKGDLMLDQELKGSPITWYYDGVLLEDGQLIQPYLDYSQTTTVTALYDGQTYSYEIPTLSKYAVVSKLLIDTDGVQITSKDDYVQGKISLSNNNQTLNENVVMRIKGRGNSTWDNPKKPFKIKFDERVSLLGMKNAKEYVLLAEYTDKTLMRNYVAHKLASMLEVGYTLDTRFVEVYLNGVYEGFYLLTEQVETDKNKLSIEAAIDIDSGFLIELEADDRVGAEGVEDIHWIRANNKNYVIKSPDTEDYTENELRDKAKSIKDYLLAFEASITNDTYEDYIDVESFIDYFIVQELTKNVDSGYSSVYSFKDANGKLTMGPLWDFDISLGNGDYFDSTPQGFHAYGYNQWFTMLFDQDSFKQAYINRYNEIYETYLPILLESILKVRENTLEARELNFTRWQIMGHYVWPNPPHMVEVTTVTGQDELLYQFLVERAEHLKTVYETT